jgi:hypothetical protein
MERVKIGKGFFQIGYGKGFNKTSVIYLINNKLYAKSKKNADVAYDGDLLKEGYVCVNEFDGKYFQTHLDNHKTYNNEQ